MKTRFGVSKSVLTPPMLFDRGDWSVIIGSWQQPKTLPARQQHSGGSYGNRLKIIQSKTYNIYLFLSVSGLKNMMKILISILMQVYFILSFIGQDFF